MKNEQYLIEQLENIRENDYMIPKNESHYEIAKQMLDHIGSVNPYLRDDLIYSTLSKWIKNDVFTPGELREFLQVSIDDEHLLFGLGETNTDSVFTRAFSVLIIAVILLKHNEKQFISIEELELVKEHVFLFAKSENDVRGYVEEKGWAHSVAHLADCLDELAKCNDLNENDLRTILELILFRAMESQNVFDCEEDERLVTAANSILKRDVLSSEEICKWMEQFQNVNKTGDYITDYYIKINAKHFLRSLYFRVDFQDEAFKETITSILLKLNRYRS
ncbi:DUF2785 domain-containing protein [Gottfriedia solisilvae]|uniref:Membrane protein n=1 Tax=Gottfriedia solisilvae TaxID=1516104 RepID=A0A8J3F1Q2_9BACI|nr:DUF2785 domain-containing protein [Gottfriedia solisilvae]GGI13581.1 membrane protein [Gottfriedia solisilvae]